MTMTMAGLLILVSVAMGHVYGQLDVTKFGWSWFLIFIGANLFQSGFTKWCMMTNMFKAVGLK